MLGELKNHIVGIRNRLASHVLVFSEPELGVDFDFVFGAEYSAQAWESALNELKEKSPNRLGLLGKIINEASSRTPEERTTFVNSLVAPRKGILITEGAREIRGKEQKLRQFLINVNSMSETNLANMQRALDAHSDGD